ncbi:proline dehydrogenase family protein [Mycolicibacterium aubagnense]|uniref:L-glutamate gamma-semialdehyde dehydrogenase n=1 Tax=Mycolicibacterium aubagnense TaxID=319707 RepID=A0ABM7IIK2_9MYCO|nr:bifunctional proline dehydrogenase/L-glutamate gamma-semialdehyde dehydrogenase [Mycolicibacterium aubagnense]TLH67549.1 1-pyrroline-5-carboxylate dehydrogenase [Mycolicibacterium aubagnense]WGI31913.1 bifunctional proline dehydrogenase/L-glutamate gamma-semialdehyde dehydrogenase [Mycolicibacterium aubagnense]BBX86573.1 1-pyrroline-5-carboxylate dehydrogenase [Mycolicibacterium aubagnense]
MTQLSREEDDLLTEVVAQVRCWLDDAARLPVAPAGRRLADVLRDPHGLEFTVGFVDRVIRPEDHRVAAANLRALARNAPGFLPTHERLLIKLGALVSVIAPGLVIPVARNMLRRMVGHLLVDATDARLGRSIARIRKRGVGLNINLLGEAVLGRAEAARRLKGTERLLARPDVDYVSIKVSATVPPHSPWAFDEAVDHITQNLLPLFTQAATAPTKKFINLDMEEYRDLELTIAVFTQLLDRPELLDLEAGIVLQAYLPDALRAMMRLQDWAHARRERGGAGIKVRLVKGANLPMEHVEASLHGWPLATFSTKQDTDTNYKRVLDYALRPGHTANVRVGVAGHNLFDIAYAWTLAGRRGVRDHVEFEMLLGMAEAQAEAVRRTVGGLLLYVPVVHPKDFDVAIAYLVRRLEEGASQDNFMSAVFELHDDQALFEREKDRFVAALAEVDDSGASEATGGAGVPEPNRRQDRRTDDPRAAMSPAGGFTNIADTDPALPGNRQWGRAITDRIAASSAGVELVAEHTVRSAAALDGIITDGVAAGAKWAASTGAERAAVLRRAAATLQAARAVLLEVMASECGKTLDQGDPEVSEAIDFANYYAAQAESLGAVDGAVAVPAGLTVVTPPWNFPVAIPAGSVLAALAAGSPVLVKPATQARRCGSVMVQALWDAGVPRDVLQLVHLDEGELGTQLVSDPRVARLILTGAFDTAELFRSFRPDLPLLAETSGKNSIIITPHADLDLAVKDLVYSAFGHAGQKCSAASLGIVVGSVARSARFRDQLVDAVTSLKVGHPTDPTVQMGPIIEPAHGKLLRALTQLAPGEQWLVAPRQLDDTGRLWSPGVKTGVRRGSEFHLTEYFGPVLGLLAADDLDEAIAIQNQVDYGLTAGLHSLDRTEIERWIDRVQAGNAYVNRSTVGAIVRRQPFGGWKKSAVGAGAKAGGPNYLIGLSDWRSVPATETASVSPSVRAILDAARNFALGPEELDFLERSFGSDAHAWATEFGVARDVSALMAEKNVFRYLPVRVTVRAENAGLAVVLRVVGAAVLAGSRVTVSTREPLDAAIVDLLETAGVACRVEDSVAWRNTLRDKAPGRVRLLGGSREQFGRDSSGNVGIALYAGPVVEAGRIELLTFLREQAIAVTAHRFGSPTPLSENLFR